MKLGLDIDHSVGEGVMRLLDHAMRKSASTASMTGQDQETYIYAVSSGGGSSRERATSQSG